MIGLDTNVLVRYFTQDDPAQAKQANRIIKRCSRKSPGYINLVVLAELFWVLSSRYQYSREQQVSLLRNMLQLEDLILESPDQVYTALRLFKNHKIQLADCLIAVLNKQAGCEKTYTFDKQAGGLDSFSILR